MPISQRTNLFLLLQTIFLLSLRAKGSIYVHAASSNDDENSYSLSVTGPCDNAQFEEFLSTYNKTGQYGPPGSNEYNLRCGYVTRAYTYINEHNNKTIYNVTLGPNSHLDMSKSELAQRRMAKIDLNAIQSYPSKEVRERRLSQQSIERRRMESLPSFCDYTSVTNPFNTIAVTSVKDQGACGVSLV